MARSTRRLRHRLEVGNIAARVRPIGRTKVGTHVHLMATLAITKTVLHQVWFMTKACQSRWVDRVRSRRSPGYLPCRVIHAMAGDAHAHGSFRSHGMPRMTHGHARRVAHLRTSQRLSSLRYCGKQTGKEGIVVSGSKIRHQKPLVMRRTSHVDHRRRLDPLPVLRC